MQIYFHRHLFSHLSRVPILVEGTVCNPVMQIIQFAFGVHIFSKKINKKSMWVCSELHNTYYVL